MTASRPPHSDRDGMPSHFVVPGVLLVIVGILLVANDGDGGNAAIGFMLLVLGVLAALVGVIATGVRIGIREAAQRDR